MQWSNKLCSVEPLDEVDCPSRLRPLARDRVQTGAALGDSAPRGIDRQQPHEHVPSASPLRKVTPAIPPLSSRLPHRPPLFAAPRAGISSLQHCADKQTPPEMLGNAKPPRRPSRHWFFDNGLDVGFKAASFAPSATSAVSPSTASIAPSVASGTGDPQACWNQSVVAEEYLNGDPWEDFEDVAREGLQEWRLDFLRMRANGLSDDCDALLEEDAPDDDDGFMRYDADAPEEDAHTKAAKCNGGAHVIKPRCGVPPLKVLGGALLAVQANCRAIGEDTPRSTTASTACSNGHRSVMSSECLSSCADFQQNTPRCEDSEHDWELEFMPRAGMITDRWQTTEMAHVAYANW